MSTSDPQQAAQMRYPAIEVHLISARRIPQTFKIQVMLPAMTEGETTRFPVVYATDGNFAFDVLKGLSYSLQRSERVAPRFILVGIGYPGDSPLAGAVLRGRDLTFPNYPKLSLIPPPVAGVLTATAGTKDFYGGEDFQAFIEEELIPFVDQRYPTLNGERTYFGHSAGGGWGLYTMFTKPALFKNYIASSPGLIFDGLSSPGMHYERYEFVPDYARRYLASGRELPEISLYMSVGAEEEYEPNLSQWQLTSSVYQMTALLKQAAIPGLRFTTEVFPAETHLTAWPLAYIHGIQHALGKSRAS